ncbi:MAG: helix-turn-helix domain-containing protein [Coraliomargarita sp.]
MKEITPEQMREWRQQESMTQTALGEKLGLPKIAITKIEGGQRQISDPEQKLLQLLINGELPFSSAAIAARTSTLDFTAQQWEVIQQAASREGYSDAKRWIIDKIKGYLRMNPESAQAQIVAEDAATYNPEP